MGKINNIVNDICNMINSTFNKQEMKFFIKKDGHWDMASKMDLLFLNKEEFMNVLPRKRGDLLQTNNWEGHKLAVFLANKNGKDKNYIVKQLAEAERMALV